MICDIKKEYSDKFDELRKARVEMSYYKYGPACGRKIKVVKAEN